MSYRELFTCKDNSGFCFSIILPNIPALVTQKCSAPISLTLIGYHALLGWLLIPMAACAAEIDPDIDVMGMFNLYFIHKLALLTADFLHYIISRSPQIRKLVLRSCFMSSSNTK